MDLKEVERKRREREREAGRQADWQAMQQGDSHA